MPRREDLETILVLGPVRSRLVKLQSSIFQVRKRFRH